MPTKPHKQKRHCKFCGKFFYKYPSQLQKFCNHKCSSKYQTKIGTSINICFICKKKFIVSKSHSAVHCCSKECKRLYQTGKNNPAWKGGPKTISCRYCKKSFILNKPHHNPNRTKFCSLKCRSLFQRKPEEKQCCICGKSFQDSAGHIKRRKTCSQVCWKKYHSNLAKKRILQFNANWKGGKSFEPYPLGWTKTFKEQIRYRDGYKCQLCGVPEVECNRKLDVHHKDYVKENLSPDNLISLCKSCHTKTNGNREYWKGYFNVREPIKEKNLQRVV